MSRIPPAVNAALIERAHGCCEMCWTPADPDTLERHHRRARGMGGHSTNLDYLENLALLHPVAHQWVHSHPLIARDTGWIVSRSGLPPELVEMVPIVPPPCYRLGSQ